MRKFNAEKSRSGCILLIISGMKQLKFFIAACTFLAFTGCTSSEKELEQGRSLMKEGKFREAIEPLNMAVNADPENAEAFNTRGVAYFELKEYSNALLDYEQAIKLEPDFYRPYYNRALLKMAQNEQNEALKDYSEAIRLAPDTAKTAVSDIYLNRGQLFALQHQETAALNDFSQAVAKNEKNALAFYNRGNILFQQKNVAGALNDFRKAVEVDSRFGKAFYALGVAQMINNEKDAGCLSLKQARQLGYADAVEAIAQYCEK